MGQDATASLSYGIIIPQPIVLALLQKLQNSEAKVERFYYQSGEPHLLEDLLNKHLKEKGLNEFKMSYLRMGEDNFKGLAIVYDGIEPERTTVWGFGSQKFQPLSSVPWDEEQVESADAAFERLFEDSLFKDLEIEVNPEWLLGCNMSC